MHRMRGCYRLDSKYHVIAVIDQESLAGAIEASNTSYAASLSNAQRATPMAHLTLPTRSPTQVFTWLGSASSRLGVTAAQRAVVDGGSLPQR